MKHISFLRKLTAAILSCTLCCTGVTIPAFSADDTEELPARFDWREADPPILTPVKLQYGGTCWAYGPMGCIEADMVRKGYADNSLDLSETHLIWFINGQGSPTDPDNPCYGGGPEYGVEGYKTGGNTYRVLAALAAWQGVVYESDYPAHSALQPLDESERYRSVAHFQNGEIYSISDRDHFKKMIMEKGPLCGSFFQSYEVSLSEKSGYYNHDYKSSETDEGGWHVIAIVGWDDHFPKEYFNKEAPSDGAWIIRNSYGENHKNSDHGYFYMSYSEKTMLSGCYFDMQPVTNYGNVYHYNSMSFNKQNTSGKSCGFVTANVFEAEKDEKIAAAGFFTGLSPEDYDLSVYLLNPDCTEPQDGTLVCRTSGTLDFKGFHTIELPEHIAVKKGQKYSVVIKQPIGTNHAAYFDKYNYKRGVSYYAEYTAETDLSKLAWKDCYDTEFGDVCIHVYTEYGKEAEQFIRGDMDRDGRLTAADLSLMKQAIREPVRSDLYRPAADWNGDSEINADDAHGLLNYLLTASEMNPEKFSASLPGVEVTVSGDKVLQKDTVNEQDYALTLDP